MTFVGSIDGIKSPRAVSYTHLDVYKRQLYKSRSFEFHLMVEEFDLDIKDLILLSSDINISLIIVHLEALINIYPTSQNYHRDLQNLSTMFNFGFAIQADSPLKENLSALVDFPVAQIMTIQPGGQGRPFEEGALQHISTLRDDLYNGYIQLDGGINDKTLPVILSQKDLPDAVCPGSYFKEDSAAKLHTLRRIYRETLQK